MNLDLLPNDLFIGITSQLDIPELIKLLLVNRAINKKCVDDKLWFTRLVNDHFLDIKWIKKLMNETKSNTYYELYKSIRYELHVIGENNFDLPKTKDNTYLVGSFLKKPIMGCGQDYLLFFVNSLLYGIGNNFKGQLGIDFFEDINKPKEIWLAIHPSDRKLKSIYCGHLHTMINLNNLLYVAGANNRGQLAISYPEKTDGFFRSPYLKNVKMISSWWSHSILLCDNKLYGVGSNSYGELGIGNNTEMKLVHAEIKLPIILTGSEKIIIAAGANHTAISVDNRLFTFGRNNCGQLGLGHTKDQNLPQEVFFPGKITDISCGGWNTAIMSKGKLYMCGLNNVGQVDLGHRNNVLQFEEVKTLQNVIGVCCAGNCTFAIANNELYVFGDVRQKNWGNVISVPQKIMSNDNIISLSAHRKLMAFVSLVTKKIDF